MKEKHKVKIALSTIYYILKNNDVTRKRLTKKYFPAKKKHLEKDLLKQFYKNVRKYDYKKIICLDETSVYINMTPSYGRANKGIKAVHRTQIYPYKKYNLIIVMKYDKIIGIELNKKSYNTEMLTKFIDKNLRGYKNYLLIMDNAVFHKSKKVIECLDKHKIKHQYIVPYHPENNPIERLFSQIKSYLKTSNCQSYEEIEKEIKYIIRHKITKNNLTNYIETLY